MKTMAKKNAKACDYRYDEKHKNNPPIGMVSYELKIADGKPGIMPTIRIFRPNWSRPERQD